MAPTADPFDLLPDSLVTTILCRVPLRNLARCELVSKKWSRLCKQVNILRLSDEDDERIVWRYFCFNRNIRGLFITVSDKSMQKTVSCWISLVRHSLQFLTITSSMFFPSVISCHKLVILTLRNCQIGGAAFGLPRLRTCQLVGVHITDEALATFLCRCPLLQYLDIRVVVGTNCFLRIDCPNLTHLVLTLRSTRFTIVNSPNLKEVVVGCSPEILKCISNVHVQHLDIHTKFHSKYSMADMIQNITLVHSLRLWDVVMKHLRIEVINDIPCLPHLKSICVVIDALNHSMLSKLRVLLSYCPALEKLGIFYRNQTLDDDSPAALLELHQLKKGVEFTCRQYNRRLHNFPTLPRVAYMP